MSYASSANGGATWTYGGLATAPDGQRLWGDPMVVVDGSGVFYMASLSGPAGVGNGIGGVAVYPSTGNSPSVTFGTPVLVNGISGTSAGGQDKEWLAVDTTGGAFNGRVYLAWTDFVTLSTGQIEFVRSTSTSPLTLTAPVAIGPADKLNHGANLAVGPAGELYLAWGGYDWSGFGVTGATIRLVKSTDGGVSFVNPDPADPNPFKTVVTPSITPDVLSSGGVSIRTRGFPYLAVDRTPAGSPTRGNLYLVYQGKTSAASTDNADIFFMSSTDGGASWSTPRTINKGPAVTAGADTTNNDNWQPAIAVSPTSGQITVTFYDRRQDPANKLIRLYQAISTDGGATWFDQPGSAVQFQPDTGYDPLLVPTYMGDYNFAASTAGATRASWGDLRNLCTPPPGAPNPCSPAGRSDMDVFTNSSAQLHGPDLAITPWGDVTGVGPTWQTPDIFVVDAMNVQVNAFKGIVNHLRARIRNVGDVGSSGATVTFKYAPWFAGITDAALKTIGTVPQDLLAGQSAVVPIDWDLTNTADTNGGLWPAPINTFDHFCVKVVISLASDVNQGNNQAQNNFFDVTTGFSQIRQAAFLVGNPFARAAEAQLVVRVPETYKVQVTGVPAGKPFQLKPSEIRLARLLFELPEAPRPASKDQVAQVDFLVDGKTVGGLALRLARANEVKPPERSFPGGRERVFQAILRVLAQRKEGVSFAGPDRRLINTRQLRLTAAQLRQYVTPEAVKKLGEAGGRATVSFKLVDVELPGTTPDAKPTPATVVAVEVLFIAESPAYVQTGGVPLASNGTLEKIYLDAIAKLLA